MENLPQMDNTFCNEECSYYHEGHCDFRFSHPKCDIKQYNQECDIGFYLEDAYSMKGG